MRSDAELVNAVRGGEHEAFAALVQRYERAVRAEALSVLQDHHAAQDIAQDAFIAGYEKLETLRDGSAFGPWILRIARSRALNSASRKPKIVPLDACEVADKQADRQVDGELQQLLAAVMQLPEHERSVVMLKYFDGHSVQAIAAMTGRPFGTVTKQLSRARTRLRKQLRSIGL